MNLSLRRSTSALLASSLLLTIGRGATLPFMTIYLSRQYSLSVDLIGYAMTIALTNPSPNRPLVTVVYKGPDFYDGEKKPPVNRR